MKKIKFIINLFMVSLLFAGSIYAGGGSRNGTAGAAQLLIPVGARGIALAGSTLVGATGLEGLYWNPASLVRSESSTNVMFSHMNYIADIGVEYGAISTNIEGFGALAFSVKSLGVDDINVTTVQNPDGTGQTFKPQFMTLGLSYARLLSDRISVGVTANLVTEQLALVSASGLSLNVGISYKDLANIDGLGFAVVLKNLGPQMKFDGSGLNIKANSDDFLRGTQYYKVDAAAFELPTTLELGFGYSINFGQMNAININGVFQNSQFYYDEYKVGLEYAFNNTLFVRGGYLLMPEANEDDRVYGLTAGVGVNYSLGDVGLRFDYAFRETKFFDDNHIFTVALGF